MDSKDFYETFIIPSKGIIHRICRAYAGSEDELKDFKQEVYIQLWKSHSNYNGQAKVSTWVYRVTLNTCLTLYKKSKKRGWETKYDSESYNISAEDYSYEKQESHTRLYEAIKLLKPADKAIIMLYLEERSYEEIAEIMGITISNVGVKINRIKGTLKNRLSHE